jgi:large subunit ribosomal protein L3
LPPAARIYRLQRLAGKSNQGKTHAWTYGVETKTVRNLEVVDIRPEENLILLKGPIPGARSGIVTINKVLFA